MRKRNPMHLHTHLCTLRPLRKGAALLSYMGDVSASSDSAKRWTYGIASAALTGSAYVAITSTRRVLTSTMPPLAAVDIARP